MPVINITKAIAEQVGNSVKRHHACCWLVADDLKCRALVITGQTQWSIYAKPDVATDVGRR